MEKTSWAVLLSLHFSLPKLLATIYLNTAKLELYSTEKLHLLSRWGMSICLRVQGLHRSLRFPAHAGLESERERERETAKKAFLSSRS